MSEKIEYEERPQFVASKVQLEFGPVYEEVKDKLVKLYFMHFVSDKKLFKKCCKVFFNVTTKEGAMSEKLLGELMVSIFDNIKAIDTYNAIFLSTMKLFVEEFWMVDDQKEHDELYTIFVGEATSENNNIRPKVPLEAQTNLVSTLAQLIDLDLKYYMNKGDTLTGDEKLLFDNVIGALSESLSSN